MSHATLPAGTDMAPVLQGLPGDRCPSPHWGIVLTGSITITHADGTSETTEAGQVYHWPAGHTGVTEGGVTFLELGPWGRCASSASTRGSSSPDLPTSSPLIHTPIRGRVTGTSALI